MADGLSALLGAAGASKTRTYDNSYIDGVYKKLNKIKGKIDGSYGRYYIHDGDMY